MRRNYVRDFERMVKELSIDEVMLIDSNHWYGDYGCIWDEWNGWHGDKYKLAKAFYKFKEKNVVSNVDRYWKRKNGISSKDTTLSLVWYKGHVMTDIETNDNRLVILSNGQIYSVEDRYWFNIQESKVLKKMLKNGYVYTDADGFLNDLTDKQHELIAKRRRNYLLNKGTEVNPSTVIEVSAAEWCDCCDCDEGIAE